MPDTVRVRCAGGCGKTQAMGPQWAQPNARWICKECNKQREARNGSG